MTVFFQFLFKIIFMAVSVVEQTEQLEYRMLTVHGHFDHLREIQMWPRLFQERFPSRENKHSPIGEAGGQVITAFYCQELQWVYRDWCVKGVGYLWVLVTMVTNWFVNTIIVVLQPFKVIAWSMFRQEILVNRGWVPMKKITPESRARGQVSSYGCGKGGAGSSWHFGSVCFVLLLWLCLHELICLFVVESLSLPSVCPFLPVLS